MSESEEEITGGVWNRKGKILDSDEDSDADNPIPDKTPVDKDRAGNNSDSNDCKEESVGNKFKNRFDCDSETENKKAKRKGKKCEIIRNSNCSRKTESDASDSDGEKARIDSESDDEERMNAVESLPNNTELSSRKSLFTKDDFEGSSDDEPPRVYSKSPVKDCRSSKSTVKSGTKLIKAKNMKPKNGKNCDSKNGILEIKSETQRLTRESNVSLPYHQPKKRTLDEFLQIRKKLLPSIPLKPTTDMIKTVGKRFQEIENEVKTLYESESDEEPPLVVEKEEISSDGKLDMQENPQAQKDDFHLSSLVDVENESGGPLNVSIDAIKCAVSKHTSDMVSKEFESGKVAESLLADWADEEMELAEEVNDRKGAVVLKGDCEAPEISERVESFAMEAEDLEINRKTYVAPLEEDVAKSALEDTEAKFVSEDLEVKLDGKNTALTEAEDRAVATTTNTIGEDEEIMAMDVQCEEALDEKRSRDIEEVLADYEESEKMEKTGKVLKEIPKLSWSPEKKIRAEVVQWMETFMKQVQLKDMDAVKREGTKDGELAGSRYVAFKKNMLAELTRKKESNWERYQREKTRLYEEDDGDGKSDDDAESYNGKEDYESVYPGMDDVDEEELVEDDVPMVDEEREKCEFLDDEADEDEEMCEEGGDDADERDGGTENANEEDDDEEEVDPADDGVYKDKSAGNEEVPPEGCDSDDDEDGGLIAKRIITNIRDDSEDESEDKGPGTENAHDEESDENGEEDLNLEVLDDDEEEEEEGVAGEVVYDSDEEIVNGMKGGDFFENEAELSESEWGSEDENEGGLDELEAEEGDKDDIDQDKLKEELGKIHMRQLLDDDKQNVKLLQEMLLEDGELHSDTKRQRRFQWQSHEEGFDLSALGFSSDQNGQNDDEEVEDEIWRKTRHEREKFLAEHEEKLSRVEIVEESELFESTASCTVMEEVGKEDGLIKERKIVGNLTFVSEKESNIRHYYGSMLAVKAGGSTKGKELKRLSLKITGKNTNKFVFASVSPTKEDIPKEQPSDAKPAKRKLPFTYAVPLKKTKSESVPTTSLLDQLG